MNREVKPDERDELFLENLGAEQSAELDLALEAAAAAIAADIDRELYTQLGGNRSEMPSPEQARDDVILRKHFGARSSDRLLTRCGRCEGSVSLGASDLELSDLLEMKIIRPIHARWVQWFRGESTPAETPRMTSSAPSSRLEKEWCPPVPEVTCGVARSRARGRGTRVLRRGMRGAVYCVEVKP